MKCAGYTGVTCINGNCPNCLDGEIHVVSCYECFYNVGCGDCYFNAEYFNCDLNCCYTCETNILGCTYRNQVRSKGL